MARYVMLLCLMASAAYLTVAQTPNAVMVEVVFDNALNHVQNNIKVVRREMSDKLCRIPVEQVVVGRGKDESNILNRQSRVQFYCLASSRHPVNTILSNCNGRWNRYQFNDEIGDHTMPDVEVEKVTCTSMYLRP